MTQDTLLLVIKLEFHLRKPNRKEKPSLLQPVLLTGSAKTACASSLFDWTTERAMISANVDPILRKA
jgi:hypothetical protein